MCDNTHREVPTKEAHQSFGAIAFIEAWSHFAHVADL